MTGTSNVGRRRREYAAVLAVGAAGAGLCLLALAQPWVESSVRTSGMPSQQVSVTGNAALGWLRAVALVGLAATAALLVTSGTARRAVGVLVAGCGLAVALGAATAGPELVSALAATAREAAVGPDAVAVQVAADSAARSAWRWVAVGAGVLLLGAGLGATTHGHRWPGMSRRYEAPAGRPERSTNDGEADRDPDALWRALNEGRDPTR